MPTTAIGRILFEDILQPSAQFSEPGKPKYTMSLLLDKVTDAAAIKQLQDECLAALRAKFGKDADPDAFKLPWRDGDVEHAEYESCQNKIEFKFSTGSAPTVIDHAMQALTDSRVCYPGCYARVAYSPYAYAKTGNRGVGLGLNAVQVTSMGEPFGQRVTLENVGKFFDYVEPQHVDLDDIAF